MSIEYHIYKKVKLLSKLFESRMLPKYETAASKRAAYIWLQQRKAIADQFNDFLLKNFDQKEMRHLYLIVVKKLIPTDAHKNTVNQAEEINVFLSQIQEKIDDFTALPPPKEETSLVVAGVGAILAGVIFYFVIPEVFSNVDLTSVRSIGKLAKIKWLGFLFGGFGVLMISAWFFIYILEGIAFLNELHSKGYRRFRFFPERKSQSTAVQAEQVK